MALTDGETVNHSNQTKQGNSYQYNDDPNQFNNTVNNFDGRRMRSKTTTRKTVDYNSSFANYNQTRIFQRDYRDRPDPQPDPLYNFQVLPPTHLLDKPVDCLNTRPIRMAMNKVKCPIFAVKWTPEGRRLITGASSGEFTLWNGLTFSFETILQAHDAAVRAMVWSHSDLWMITADHNGFVKYWQSNMNNVKMYQIHKEPVRGLSFSPTDQKFASCSDDSTVRIWDFLTCAEERILRGHGSDVRCVDWHPFNSLLLSGSRDAQQPLKMWDPRSAKSVTIHAHKNTVMDLKWNRNGKLFLTASRDHLVKLFDIRNLKAEVQTFKGHNKEATALSWHPIHEELFASGGSDGSIFFWLLGKKQEVNSIASAHDTMVWSLDWHPLGHILVSGSNDHTTKFWTRSRFGDQMRDRYNLNTLPPGVEDPDDIDSTELEHSAPKVTTNKLHFFSNTGPIPFFDTIDDASEVPALSDGILSDVHFDKLKDNSFKSSKKLLHSKAVPHDFQRAWMEGRQPPTLIPSLPFEDPDLTLEEDSFPAPKQLPPPPHHPPFPPNHPPKDFYPDNEWGYNSLQPHQPFRAFPSQDGDFEPDFHPHPPPNWGRGRGRFPRKHRPFNHHDNYPHDNRPPDNPHNPPNNYQDENRDFHHNNNYNNHNFKHFNKDNQGYNNHHHQDSHQQQPFPEQQHNSHENQQQQHYPDHQQYQQHPPQKYPHQEIQQQKYPDQPPQNNYPDQQIPAQNNYPDQQLPPQNNYPDQQQQQPNFQPPPPKQPFHHPSPQQQTYNHFNETPDNSYKNFPPYHHGNDDNRGRPRDFYGNQRNNRSGYRGRGRSRGKPYQRNR